MKYLNIVVALLPSLSIAKLGETHHDRRQQANPPLVQVGLNPSFKLGRCEGDCDDDSDCNSSDLVCFGRTEAYEDVPGCSGGLNDPSSYDYCVRKSDLNDAPTQDPPAPVGGSVKLTYSKNFPLSLCKFCFKKYGSHKGSLVLTFLVNLNNVKMLLGQGDCDSNSDCRGGMVCFQRNEHDPVPGCVGGENDGSRTDYCIASSAPAPSPTTTVVTTGDKELKSSSSFPLSECEGTSKGRVQHIVSCVVTKQLH
jgi:hypothetical protein